MFIGYGKISESTGAWKMDRKMENLIKSVDWVVTEKIHGANFVFVWDGEVLKCAKRTKLLTDDDSFFCYHVLLERYKDVLSVVFGLVEERLGCEIIEVFGELYGGSYPHEEVDAVPGVKAVQTGVWYSPDLEFMAFDILTSNNGEEIFMDYGDAMEIFKEAGLPFAKPLFQGSLKDCVSFDLNFDSHIPAQLGYPPIENNQSEGVVIKTLRNIHIQIPTKKGSTRAIVKLKHPDFKEKKYSEASKWDTDQNGIPNIDFLEWESSAMINSNRINNCISKIGEVERTDYERW